jgi:hypothetical protein
MKRWTSSEASKFERIQRKCLAPKMWAFWNTIIFLYLIYWHSFRNSDYVVSNERVIGEWLIGKCGWKRSWTNLSYYPGMSGETEEDHKRHQSGYLVSGPRFEPGTSRIQRRGQEEFQPLNHDFRFFWNSRRVEVDHCSLHTRRRENMKFHIFSFVWHSFISTN